MKKFLDSDGLLYLWSKIKTLLGGKMDKSGGTMTGKITLDGAPTADLHAATKKYVDDSMAGAGVGDMLKSTYDKDGDGIVDNAAKVNNLTVLTAVPTGAKFTDTTYNAATSSAAGLMSAQDFIKLSAFGESSSYALKSDITATYRYKGSKTNLAALPSTGNQVGDIWNTEDTGMNYAWTGTEWDALGEVFTVDPITNADIDAITA